MQQLSAMLSRKGIPFVLVVLFLLIGLKTHQPHVAAAQPKSLTGFESGFNEQFSDGGANWGAWNGDWTVSTGYLRGVAATKQSWSHVYFAKANYSNLDYQVRMRRTGCGTCTNGIHVRGTTSSIRFKYINTGEYTIEKCGPSVCTTLDPFTTHSAILKGGYNTLRIVAIGNTYDFLINNKLIVSHVITGLSSGNVGVSFYSNQITGNTLDVDWAVLNRR